MDQNWLKPAMISCHKNDTKCHAFLVMLPDETSRHKRDFLQIQMRTHVDVHHGISLSMQSLAHAMTTPEELQEVRENKSKLVHAMKCVRVSEYVV
jgi:hypothetical protein